MTKTWYRIRKICSILIGIVFFIAGISKLMDPVGAGLVVGEYFKFFHLGFLNFASQGVGVTMALLETLMGAALITRVFRKLTAILTSVMTAFFTLLTLILLIFNPPMDCGCFGEVVELSHLETFLKNIGLCILAAVAFLPMRDLGHSKKSKHVSFWIVTVSVIFFALASLMSIPLVDYTPYKVDSELAAVKRENMNFDEYMSTFIYEKNGVEGSFTLDNLPDSTWVYKKTETVKRDNADEGDIINSLSFTDASGHYQDSLAGNEAVMIVSLYKPSTINGNTWKKISAFLSDASKEGFNPLLLLSTTPAELEKMLSKANLTQTEKATLMISAYFSDYKTLISLNRSNGGATYYYNGELICKWAQGVLPDKDKLAETFSADQTDLMLKSETKGRLFYHSFLLYVFAIMIFI